MATNTSLRPRIRPDNNNKQATGTQRLTAWENFGDIEFKSDLKELLDKDPIAALGFDAAKTRYTLPQEIQNAYYMGGKKGSRYTQDGTYIGEQDDVIYGPAIGASKDIIVHEYRHRGHRILRDAYFKDKESFTKKYGQDVVDFLIGDFPSNTYYEGDRNEEFRTELGDNLDATFIKPRPNAAQAAQMFPDMAELFPKEELEKTGKELYTQLVNQADEPYNLSPELREELLDKLVKGSMLKGAELVTKKDQEKYKGILTKVRQAASNILKERKGFDEGGLATQMTNIFGKQILYPVGDPRTEQKGMGYGKLIVDNIIGLDNEYESFGDVLRSEFKKDKLGFLSNITKSAVEGTRGFLQKPADQQMNVVKNIAKEIKDSVVRLNTQDLDKRLQNMFGVSYQKATEDQVNKVKESVIGDSIAALELTGLTGPVVMGGKATVSGIKKGARSALDTSKRMIPTKKVDDAYNPVIGFGGEDSYDPIVEKYLNPDPEELLALALKKDLTKADENKIVKFNNKSEDEKFALELLKEQAAKSTPDPEKLLALLASGPTKKNLSGADKQLIKDLDKELKLLDKDIDELQDIKDSGLFNNETDLLMAHAKGVLSTPEYFRSKYDFMQTKLNSLDPSDPKYKEYEKFTDVYNRVDLASLLDFARDYPAEPNIASKQYLQYADDVRKYDNKLVEYADDIGVDPNDFIDVVQDAIPFVGDNVFPDYLPRAKETGDLYPRKATDYTQSNTQSLLAKIPKGSDRAASKLGFDDTVYHLAVSKDEFTKFKNVDDLIPEVRDGPTNKFEGTPHDLLGVHVGTARAAAERFRAKSVDFEETPRYTMQLRAKLDKPVRVEDISEIVGFDPLKLQLDDSGLNFTEKDLKTIIYNKAMQKNNAGDYISTTMENQAAIELRKELADSGFTHIPYVNELEDKESISYIMLVDRKKGDPAVLRDYNAKFDPEEAASTDLRMSQGGVTMKDQMQMAFMQEGGLKDDGMDVDPVSGNDVPPGSMASEVRDDIPAQLSEGEYVVPADVVQYYGVKFFEDLRMDAKRGLADMESNGRIGGEPVDMPRDMPMDMPMNQGGVVMPDDMGDDEPTMITDAGVEYNVGGMTSNLYNNPTQMDQEVNNIISTMYNNPQVMDELSRRGIQLNRTQAPMNPQQMNQANPPAEARMGFSPGGLAGNEAAAYDYITSPTTVNPMYQTPGASYMYAAPPQLTTTAQETTPSVEYCDKVGMDYDPVAKMCIPRPIEQASQGGGDNDDPGTNLPKVEPDKWMEDFDYSGTDEGMQNLLQQSSDLLDPPERTGLGGAVAGMLDNTILGKFSAGSNAAKVAANMIILDHYGVDTTALNTKYKDYVKTNLSGVPKGLYNGDSFAKQAAIKHGLSLSLSAEDPFGDKIFKGRDDYRKFLENDERKENIRSRYRDMSINPLKSTGRELTEKQKRDSKSDAGLAAAAKITTPTTAAGKAAARKRGDEISKQGIQRIIDSGDTYSSDTKTAIKQMKERGTFNVGGRNKGGLMKKKKK